MTGTWSLVTPSKFYPKGLGTKVTYTTFASALINKATHGRHDPKVRSSLVLISRALYRRGREGGVYSYSSDAVEGPRVPVVKVTTSHHHRRRRVRRIGHHDRCLLTLVLVYSTRRHGVCMVVYVQFSSVGAGTVWGRLIALLTRVRGPLQAAKPCRQSTRWTRDV
jgi:hypothetical protein